MSKSSNASAGHWKHVLINLQSRDVQIDNGIKLALRLVGGGSGAGLKPYRPGLIRGDAIKPNANSGVASFSFRPN